MSIHDGLVLLAIYVGVIGAGALIAQTAQQPQPNAPQKLWASAAGTRAPSAAAWSWPEMMPRTRA